MNAVEIFTKYVEQQDDNLGRAISFLSNAPDFILWSNDHLLQESPGSKFILLNKPSKECSVILNGTSFTFVLVCSRGSYNDAQSRAERIFMAVDENGILVGYVRVLGYFDAKHDCSVSWVNIYTEVRPQERREVEWRT